jgi:F-type H+-transporting ATPase subunit b
VDLLAVVGGVAADVVRLAAEAEGESGGFQLNIFWILVSSLNFLFFFFVITYFAWGPLTRILDERRDRIEQGLRDADQARRDRESAEQERLATLAEARREANEILARSQKVAQESREADIAATRLELERMRTRAAADIEAEKHRAIADLRAEVADLALQAAGRVVGESMTGDRQRRLVEEFLAGSASGGGRDA